ncbi:MAG: PH domain-containing protein [Thermoguttaceae bacterium]|nr:PH domain-containing protein [Thermoguttaceae bacterium]MBR5760148.1 PH domain-containing protein [Thermoguttaceae bacterium]
MDSSTKKPADTTTPVGPWRSGRSSKKAFYPHMVLLAIVWIAFVILGARCSCAAIKSKKAVPEEVQSSATATFSDSFALDFFFPTSAAYAQDEPSGELPADEPAVEEPALELPAEEPVVEEPAPELPAEEPVAEEPVAQEPVAAEPVADEPVAEQGEPAPAAPKKGKFFKFSTWSIKSQLAVIWILCLTIPVLLTVWVLIKMIWKIYGFRYEIRTDDSNPNATSFLITRGIFNKSTDTMHIGDIKDIKSEQSLWQKYCKGGVGTIVLYTKDLTDGIIKMVDMDEPSRVFNAFDTLRRHFWSRGGMQLGNGVHADGGDMGGNDLEIQNDLESPVS